MSALDSFFGEGATAKGLALKQALKAIQKTKVQVGFDGATYPDGTPVATVALTLEHGTSTIPARPFMQQTIDRNRGKINKLVQDIGAAACRGESTSTALRNLQEGLQSAFQTEITSGAFAPNAASTVSRKGSSTPLVDTGLLSSSIKVTVTK